MKSVSSIVNEMDMSETVEYLLNNESSFIVSQDDINKIKADAVHAALDYADYHAKDSLGWIKSVNKYANELERGEHE